MTTRTEVEFLPAEGLTQLDPAFEEEFRTDDDRYKFTAACCGPCTSSAQIGSFHVPFPEIEDPALN